MRRRRDYLFHCPLASRGGNLADRASGGRHTHDPWVTCCIGANTEHGHAVEGTDSAVRGIRPERTKLYAVVRDNLETLYGAVDDGAIDVKVSKHARKELEAYVERLGKTPAARAEAHETFNRTR